MRFPPLRKLTAQARLLRQDPEAFARNVMQFTHRARYLERLTDYPSIVPIATVVEHEAAPRLNVLLPAIKPTGMTGGPNTVLQLGCAIAHTGTQVRFVSCDQPAQGGEDWFWSHIAQITAAPKPPTASLADTAHPLPIGPEDRFLASFWTTAHQAQAMLKLTTAREFLYLIQDFEPGFYPWSSSYALALASYDMPYRAIVNEAVLADYLAQAHIGRFAEPAFRADCLVFEPALDRGLFTPAPRAAGRRRQLLVYARPTNPRNMLGMAIEALNLALAAGHFQQGWDFIAIGARGSLPELKLAGGQLLRQAPWVAYAGYAALLQQADILLCPMLSPHTSYPVLEMAACGGLAVTTSFGPKTAALLHALSPNILAAPPAPQPLADLLAQASRQEAEAGAIALPSDWAESLAPVVAGLAARGGADVRKEGLLF